MESTSSQNKSEAPVMAYTFVSSHAADISSDKKEFSGACLCDPGPSFARCQPIENNPIITDSARHVHSSIGVLRDTRVIPAFPSKIIFKIVTKAKYYADCSLGIHTDVDDFFSYRKRRIGYEVSVHGHRVSEYYKYRGISSNVKEIKNADENAKDWMDKRWADGDIIMLVFTNPMLKWFWNGVEQSCIDVSEENDLISSEFLKSIKNRVVDKNPKADKGVRKWLMMPWFRSILLRKKGENFNREINEPKWCFYVRGVNMTVRIQDEDLTEREYEELRNSYADRLKIMQDKIDEQGPTDPDDW